MSNRSSIEMIKQKLPIESVVGSYVKLDRVGNKWKAKCPFHNEKTASFQVDSDKGFYYCFGCHKGGDIFSFVQEMENVEFYDALKLLADKAGVQLGDYTNEKPSRLSVLREIMGTATKLYEIALRKDARVVAYLTSRGLTKETIVKWRIGFAPKGWSYAYDYLKQRTTALTPEKKYSDDDIVATGLCLKSDRGRGCYDRFRERITYPIADSQGRVIAFSARVLPGTEEEQKPVGKYINSPETDLYHKSSVLYGFDQAKTEIHKRGYAILVEGQMDCIMSHQAGYANTVALSGTACTDEQVAQLARFTNDLAIALDADAAGLVAAQKSAMVAYRHGMNVSIIDIPSGKDPADAIREDADVWRKAVDGRTDYISFRLEKMKSATNTDKVTIATKELFPVLAQMQFQMSIDEKLQEIAHAFAVAPDAIRKDFERHLRGTDTELTAVAAPHAIPDRTNQREALVGNMVGILLSIANEYPFAQLKDLFETSGLNYAKLVETISIEDRARYLAEIESMLGPAPDNIEIYKRMFKQFHTRYRLLILEEEKYSLDIRLRDNPNDTDALAKMHAILKEKDRFTHLLHNH